MHAGRPAKFTPDLQARVIDLLRLGNYRHVAARAVGISPRTLSQWVTSGKRRPDSEYGEFSRQVHTAEAEAQCRMVGVITDAAKVDARHAQWFLERRYPELWGSDRGELRKLVREFAALRAELAGGPG